MTQIPGLDALDQPLKTTVVDGEVLLRSDQTPIDLAVTAEAAGETGHRLIAAAKAAKVSKKVTPDDERLDEGLEETFPASDPVSAQHID